MPRKPLRALFSHATGITSQSARRCTACRRCRRSCPHNPRRTTS
ncbi:4Fe-4S dicluster domain-containing protein [Burkholderia cenocepacia]|nr:4Fe-4S dicluster domain-containing protein [Burkholderia cenocepacia]